MTVHNLYNYHTLLSVGKLLKFHTPISLYSLFSLSKRKNALLTTPQQADSFVCNSSALWNAFRRTPEGSKVKDFTATVGCLKNLINTLLYRRQKLGDSVQWHPQINYNVENIF